MHARARHALAAQRGERAGLYELLQRGVQRAQQAAVARQRDDQVAGPKGVARDAQVARGRGGVRHVLEHRPVAGKGIQRAAQQHGTARVLGFALDQVGLQLRGQRVGGGLKVGRGGAAGDDAYGGAVPQQRRQARDLRYSARAGGGGARTTARMQRAACG